MLTIDYKDEELVRWLLVTLQSDGRYRLTDIVRPDEALPDEGLYIQLDRYTKDHKFIVGGDISLDDTISLVSPLDPKFELYAAIIEPLELDNRQIEFITSYSQIAKHWSQHSYCVRRKVGALIVKDNAIISDGFNGTPSGFENCCELEVPLHDLKSENGHYIVDDNHSKVMLKTRPEVLHAESNALMKCARMGRATDGADLYVSCSPCIECSKLIIQAGIKRVFFSELYKDVSGVLLLLKSGIEVNYFPITESI